MQRRFILQLMTAGAVSASLKIRARADAGSVTVPARPVAGAAGMTAGESVIDLTVADLPLRVNCRTGNAVAVNGAVPGPIIRLRDGQDAVLRVTNRLKEITSIHWHGVLLPPDMDGVPGISFGGIKPGETFTYRFPVTQSGTYWAHSHSAARPLFPAHH